MLRLTELKLPIGHGDGDIAGAILERLRIKPDDLRGYSVFRRAIDARKKSAIALTYTLDIDVKNEAAVLARDPQIGPGDLLLAPLRAPGTATTPTVLSVPSVVPSENLDGMGRGLEASSEWKTSRLGAGVAGPSAASLG